ncbi:hypothetical protein [Tenacibaculum finnmarkense]|uniref:hypothetical protein n=1 Tax=Tenacibaculum finnmarkense TaxID=2781243 RepID=UPI001EFBF53C|nr:hypothetical protein [Tenacibaculum finnmarkense]MCG8208146.1 hypothetical protein [Tenacibaculum finnmarkense genomovar finnmarkense]MCG8724144.1 hypothetical protein [Tenacibaculum finnmarkense]MCG8742481.1 hypothetical protein [Tenacibaculum finnmarkense]MCG8765924.1 hypothetical protein [Tenacibaculum finnmarkense]MCG8778797.1 hypothetical protein [Tenacibaculum finnmarkense]
MKKLTRIYFIIIVIFFIGCEAVFLEDISNDVIIMIAPKDNVKIEEGAANFIWESVSDASEYQLQIAQPTFNEASQILLDTIITKTSFIHTMKIGAYEWRVKAKNTEYETLYTIQKVEVSSDDITNSEVALLLPLDAAISNSVNQKLSWTELTGATEYRVQIWESTASEAKIKDVIVTGDSYTYNFLEGEFIWKVRPQSNSQNGKYTERSITVDSKKPNTPENTIPANNGTQTETTINFSWTRTIIEGTEEIDSIYVFKDVSLETLVFKDQGANKSYTKENLEPNLYYWNVQSFDKAMNKSGKSNQFKINIE